MPRSSADAQASREHTASRRRGASAQSSGKRTNGRAAAGQRSTSRGAGARTSRAKSGSATRTGTKATGRGTAKATGTTNGAAGGGGTGGRGTRSARGAADGRGRSGGDEGAARAAEEVRAAAAGTVARRAATARARTSPPSTPSGGDGDPTRVALDVLLSDAAFAEGAGRFVQPRAAVRVLGGLAIRPHRIARRAGGLGVELAKVAAGRSEVTPAKADRRFRDRGWHENWLLRRLMQAHLAAHRTADDLIDDSGADWQSARLARFVSGNVLDALAPSNFPWSNPSVLRETVDRGGANFVDGGRRLAGDLWPPRLPASVDTTQFALGENLAVTPGAVVLRHEMFELLEYRPSTEQVHEVPLLIVPPTINRYYIFDIAPGRSMIEHLVAQGQRTFAISWRNPTAEHAGWDLDAYARAVLDAHDAMREITGAQTANLSAACAGGLIVAGLLGHLAHRGELHDRFASLTLQVCALDSARAGDTAAMSSRDTAALAVAESARRGYLDGRQLAGVFAWLRPNDLIWSYVVNNYLLGKAPPAFDVLYWNQDAVRLAAGLHRDFMHLALDNQLAHAGALEVLGSPVDLGAVDLDAYLVAASGDHIVPWPNAYRGVELLGGTTRFVLSTSGHIQALVNPPGDEARTSFRVADDPTQDPDAFEEEVSPTRGSWWGDHAAWLAERAGGRVAAPADVGSAAHPPLDAAPGAYVLEA